MLYKFTPTPTPTPTLLTSIHSSPPSLCVSQGAESTYRHCCLCSHETNRSSFNSSHHSSIQVVVNTMEAPPYYASPQQHHGSSRPTIGFPLGTALLLIVVFTLSGIFSCCYHWDKLRHLRGEFSDADPHEDDNDSPSKPKPIYSEKKGDEDRSLPVIMAGDQFARFIAMPCPCEPPRKESITGEEIQTPPKPPHVSVTIR